MHILNWQSIAMAGIAIIAYLVLVFVLMREWKEHDSPDYLTNDEWCELWLDVQLRKQEENERRRHGNLE